MQGNPFKPTFGSEPLYFAGRDQIITDMLEGLQNSPGDPNRSTVLIGPRGSGKTVLLVRIADEASAMGWVYARVTAQAGMLENLMEQIRANACEFIEPLQKHSLKSVQVAGVGFTQENIPAAQGSWRLRATELIEELNEKGIGLLLEIDEVDAEVDEMIQLVSDYQHFVSEKRNVALLMAGLPGKITSLFLHDKISFIRRSFQKQLGVVSIAEATVAMRKTIEASGRAIDAQALELAVQATEGFPFIIQLVGYHIWRQSPKAKTVSLQDAEDGILIAEQDMNNMILDTTIRELSQRDLDFLIALSVDEDGSNLAEIAERMGAKGSLASRYKKRMIAQGLVAEHPMGKLRLEMPFLRDYIIEHFSAGQ